MCKSTGELQREAHVHRVASARLRGGPSPGGSELREEWNREGPGMVTGRKVTGEEEDSPQ